MKYYKIQYGGLDNDIELKIIDNLKNDIYCRIKRSKVHGVGVFAIKDIPKGINPFKNLVDENKKEYIDIHKNKIKNLSKDVKKMLDDYLGINEDNTYSIPIDGINKMDISFFMNHSNNPNISIENSKDTEKYVIFYAKRNIKKGEELLINYNNY